MIASACAASRINAVTNDRGPVIAPMFVEEVTPAGLRVRAEIMRDEGYASCARHLELAADRIENLERRTTLRALIREWLWPRWRTSEFL